MSHIPTHAVTDETRQLLYDVKTLAKDDLESTYGIQINESGSVYDSTYDRTFRTITQWTEHELEQVRFSSATEDDEHLKW